MFFWPEGREPRGLSAPPEGREPRGLSAPPEGREPRGLSAPPRFPVRFFKKAELQRPLSSSSMK